MQQIKTSWQRANQRGDISTALLALAPAMLLYLVFNVYPLFYSGYLSLLEWDGFGADKKFVGLQNYRDFLTTPEFTNSLEVTIIYTIGVTVMRPRKYHYASLTAVAVNKKIIDMMVREGYLIPDKTASAADNKQ